MRQGALHVVGRVTEEVFSFLGPATAALCQSGVRQTVVMLADPRDRQLIHRFDERVALAIVPESGSLFARWREAYAMFRMHAASADWEIVHAHGFTACVLSLVALRGLRKNVAFCYSPHGSKSLSHRRLSSQLLRWLGVRSLSCSQASIASLPTEASALASMIGARARLVEHTVPASFAAAARQEAPQPWLVTGGNSQDPSAARLFEQLAVVFGAGLKMRFLWIGSIADPAVLQSLVAAGVEVVADAAVEKRVALLTQSWLYVAPAGARGFPSYLAEAMAAGLPCVAIDTPVHRDLIVDGQTGYLCADIDQMLLRIGQLLDDEALRRSIGTAARRTAQGRFGEVRFRELLLEAYGS